VKFWKIVSGPQVCQPQPIWVVAFQTICSDQRGATTRSIGRRASLGVIQEKAAVATKWPGVEDECQPCVPERWGGERGKRWGRGRRTNDEATRKGMRHDD
jgi:hypothetical protein